MTEIKALLSWTFFIYIPVVDRDLSHPERPLKLVMEFYLADLA